MERYPRRTALHLGGTALVAALAGCSGGGDSSDSDPDAGTDSYGITAQNSHDGPYDVRIVADPIDGDTVFEETVTVAPDEPKSWDEVLTEPGMTQVKAELLNAEQHFDGRFMRDSNYVNVGGDNAPAVSDVVVEVYGQEVAEFSDGPVTAIKVTVGDRGGGQ